MSDSPDTCGRKRESGKKKISGYVWTGPYTTLDVNFVKKNKYDLSFPILNNARRHKS